MIKRKMVVFLFLSELPRIERLATSSQAGMFMRKIGISQTIKVKK